MNHLTSMTYNDENRLEVVVDASGDITSYYQYDMGGQRVRKTVINTASHTAKMRKYVANWEVYTEYDTATTIVSLERETLHIMDEKARIALIDTPITLPVVGEVQLLRYQFSNHLSTATLELDVSADIISYEEYYPFGNTSFQCGRSGAEVSLKRYRYTSKERDEETGLYYHGARYYIPWLARWCAVDPLESKYSPESTYCYGHNNPVTWQDSTGMGPDVKTPYKPEPGTGTKTGTMETSTVDGKLTGESANFGLNEVTIKAEATTANKVKSFFKGFAEGVLIAASVVAIIAFTGGLGFVAAAGYIGYAAFAVGTASVAKTIVESTTGKDFFTGEKLSSLDKAEAWGGIAGGIIGGGITGRGLKGLFETKSGTGLPESINNNESGLVSDNVTTVERGTRRTTELRILDDTGYLMSDAAQEGYMESNSSTLQGKIDDALTASQNAHEAHLKLWGSLDMYIQAHSMFGTAMEEVAPRSMISVTTQEGYAERFAKPVFRFDVPKELLHPQTLPGAGEDENLIFHMIKIK